MQAPCLISRSCSRSSGSQSARGHCCHPCTGSSSSRHSSMVVAAGEGSAGRGGSSSSKRPPLRKKRDQAAAESASALARTLTEMITGCRSITELSGVCEKCSGSFNYRHTTTAFIKAAQFPPSDLLPDGATTRAVLDRLAALWEEQLPAAGVRELATVLWICSQLCYSSRKSLWSSTLEAFMRRNRGKAAAQEYSNVLRAVASIGKPTMARCQA